MEYLHFDIDLSKFVFRKPEIVRTFLDQPWRWFKPMLSVTGEMNGKTQLSGGRLIRDKW